MSYKTVAVTYHKKRYLHANINPAGGIDLYSEGYFIQTLQVKAKSVCMASFKDTLFIGIIDSADRAVIYKNMKIFNCYSKAKVHSLCLTTNGLGQLYQGILTEPNTLLMYQDKACLLIKPFSADDMQIHVNTSGAYTAVLLSHGTLSLLTQKSHRNIIYGVSEFTSAITPENDFLTFVRLLKHPDEIQIYNGKKHVTSIYMKTDALSTVHSDGLACDVTLFNETHLTLYKRHIRVDSWRRGDTLKKTSRPKDLFSSEAVDSNSCRYYYRGEEVSVKKHHCYNTEALHLEIRMLSIIHNPHISNLVAVTGLDTSLARIKVISEYMPNVNLYEYIKAAKGDGWDNSYNKVMYHVSAALEYLHSKRIIHGNVESKHILLGEKHNAKLAHFSFAQLLPHGGSYVTLNSYHAGLSTAPEVRFKNELHVGSDIYGMGVIMYELYHKKVTRDKLPSQGKTSEKLDNPHFLKFDAPGLPKLTRLVRQCFFDDPKQRPSAKSIKAFFKDTLTVGTTTRKRAATI